MLAARGKALDGAISGRALYEGRLDPAEAIKPTGRRGRGMSAGDRSRLRGAVACWGGQSMAGGAVVH